jgi:hypothetical protein
MCLRFQFCTHPRICVLHFLKKSQIRCTLINSYPPLKSQEKIRSLVCFSSEIILSYILAHKIMSVLTIFCYFHLLISFLRALDHILYTAWRGIREDDNWKTVAAKRRREKDDIYRRHPSFDPIFMKV